MPRFQCTACHQCYEDMRFLWEEAEAEARQAEESSGSSTQEAARGDDADAHAPSLEILSERDCHGEDREDDARRGAARDKLADKLDEAETLSQADSEETAAGSDGSSVSSGPDTPRPAPCEAKVQSQGHGIMYGDLCRAAGTTAKLAAACGESHLVCGPISVAGSAAGLATGFTQLRRGLSTPSGLVDQHLVSKGVATTGIGATNVCICVKATLVASPHLFGVALALSVVNTGIASTIDTHVPGLCSACREASGKPDAVATALKLGPAGSLLAGPCSEPLEKEESWALAEAPERTTLSRLFAWSCFSR